MTSLPLAAFAPVLFCALLGVALAAAVRTTTPRRPASAAPRPAPASDEPLRPAA